MSQTTLSRGESNTRWIASVSSTTPRLGPRWPPVFDTLALPIIGSPLFIISCPELVIAQCKAGIVGSFPALNARPQTQLDEWLHQITEALAAHDRAHPDRPAAPFAVNQIVHRSNTRLEDDLATLLGILLEAAEQLQQSGPEGKNAATLKARWKRRGMRDFEAERGTGNTEA